MHKQVHATVALPRNPVKSPGPGVRTADPSVWPRDARLVRSLEREIGLPVDGLLVAVRPFGQLG